MHWNLMPKVLVLKTFICYLHKDKLNIQDHQLQ